jgi:hypothetical protein
VVGLADLRQLRIRRPQDRPACQLEVFVHLDLLGAFLDASETVSQSIALL